MRKGFMGIISLALIFCLVLAGCGSAQAKDSVSEEAAQSEEQGTPEVASVSSVEQDTPEVTQQGADQQAAEGEEAMSTGTYTTQEIWVQNGDDRIYGVAYVPASEDGKKVPLVIFSPHPASGTQRGWRRPDMRLMSLTSAAVQSEETEVTAVTARCPF